MNKSNKRKKTKIKQKHQQTTNIKKKTNKNTKKIYIFIIK